MSKTDWQRVSGIVERGHRVASGTALNSPYQRGTIEMQLPYFKALGLDLTGYFQGTLNVSIRPKTFQLLQPEFTFRSVEWTDQHPPEDFSFSRCQILFQAKKFDGLIYFPHPETKERHFQDPSVIEIIATPIAELAYGDRVDILYNPSEVVIQG
ncbi:hypothetical protein [Nodosilinea sp. E11]|uniref:hypothetical protein n=1 Tax=Nodosilinea sp. E11 TaxID=3037479 RepID=UPI0029340E9A|nr:hypothetical protein [Nodosilinea sp. E11]WOD39522.1 hypothetical protein RRF56_25270 [Nodosilinea sp. E11]